MRLQPVHDPADDEIRHIIDGDVGMVGEGTLGGVAQHDGATVLRPVFLHTPNSNWDNICEFLIRLYIVMSDCSI